jgi:uncharacterized protein YndB with AHSA1/START domain
MSTRKHVREIELPAPPEEVFALLHTPSAIRGWWAASRVIVVPSEGGVWAAAWGEDEDAPEYVTIATLAAFEPPRRLLFTDYRYWAHTGPLPFDAELTTEFTVRPAATGSVLRVVQDGFPEDASADEFYAACDAGWQNTLGAIRGFVERSTEY